MDRRKFFLASGVSISALGLGAFFWPRRWKYIVIHHSGGNYATIEFLQQVHRERQKGDPIDAIPYHYVIGNGNGLGMGEIASDWRKDLHIWGTHVSENNIARNFFGIGICLVGNFEEAPVPAPQLDTLIRLTRSLMREHDIPVANVSGHGHIDGESTKCPGRYFPMSEFLEALV